MTTDGGPRCERCDAPLSAWEIREAEMLGAAPCWCGGLPLRVTPTLANLSYAGLCRAGLCQPVKIHDVVRFVEREYRGNPRYSINVALSQGKRFCWGGRALYGLARHGLVPGARSLAEATYAVLLASDRPLHFEEVDFVLEQLNYRFNSDSLLHHLRGYTDNRWDLRFKVDDSHRVWVHTGRDPRHDYNAKVRVCPTHSEFDRWIEGELAPRVGEILVDRAHRLAGLISGPVDIAGDRIEFR